MDQLRRAENLEHASKYAQRKADQKATQDRKTDLPIHVPDPFRDVFAEEEPFAEAASDDGSV